MRPAWLLVIGALAVARPGGAQQEAASRAFELERRGNYAAAAEAFRRQLKVQPGDIGALLGLERSLQALNQQSSMAPELSRALVVGPPSGALYGMAVRVWSAAKQQDSVRAAVERWAALEPGSEAPYQEWGTAALSTRDRAAAKEAYSAGRERLKTPDALAGEFAQLATIEGDNNTAVTEWLKAIAKTPGYRSAAASMLGQVGGDGRQQVLKALGAAGTTDAERLAATLMVRWGDPVGAVRRIERILPTLGDRTVETIRETLDDLRGANTREGQGARGSMLELLASKVPAAQAPRYWLEAAQSYSDAGDQPAARRMLARLAGDPNASSSMAASATSTLVGVLITEGKLEDAERQFKDLQKVLAPEEREMLLLKLADGWLRRGDLTRADKALAADSTVEALALRGRIQLYRGDIAGAAELLKAAGPFAGERDGSTARTSLLSLIQVVEADSLPVLGDALFRLERRDSAAAATGFEAVGAKLPPDKGGAEVLLLAGRVRLGMKQLPEAQALFKKVASLGIPASAAQAELEEARLLLEQSDRGPAIQLLEHLLVTYASSAVAPQARRLLDQARGGIPPS